MICLITPTWNCGEDFARLAASVDACGDDRLRWIVVENGSRPAERELVEDALRGLRRTIVQEYIVNPRNLGIPVAQNQALDRIWQGGWKPNGVVFLSADTEIKRVGWLDTVLAFIDENRDAGIVGLANSPGSQGVPVFHHPNGRWYVHDGMRGGIYQGESVDFAAAFVRGSLVTRGLRFDETYHVYDGYDQDLCFRVRAWGFQVWHVDAGIVHYGSSAMKKAGYQWEGGGREEWDELRARNVARFADLWGNFLALPRKTIDEEMVHVEKMNAKLIMHAGELKVVPKRNRTDD